LRLLGLVLAVAFFGWLGWRLLHPPPTPLPARLIERCEAQAIRLSRNTYVTLGPETRRASSVKTPWRCDAPFTPGGEARLALALGTEAGVARPRLRVSFVEANGRTRILREDRRRGPGSQPGWQDLSFDLSSLPHRRGRLRIEVGTDAGVGVPFHLAEPILFRPVALPSPNLVVILLDTLRADRVGFAGYSRPTTPALDALAAGGTIFTRAYAPCSWTRPSTTTLLTGLEPADHRVDGRAHHVPEALVTLAERLREVGYATSAFSSNPNVIPYWGFDQGFERFLDFQSKNWARNDDVAGMVDLVLQELERVRNRPFFLYLHINQIHSPYAPPAAHLRAVRGDPGRPSDLYDGEIHFTDAELGRLWDRLRALGLDERTLLVVVGDHGEEFQEHGGDYHGKTLYEEVLRVPLFLRWPGVVPEGRRIERWVGLAAVTPTVLSLLRLPGAAARGPTLLGVRDPAENEPVAPFYFSLDHDGRRLHAVSDGRWKYIRTMQPSRAEELYDLAADPAERHSRAQAERGERGRLVALLERRLSAHSPGLQIRLSAGTAESLKIRLNLRTSGRVERVKTEGMEPGDRARVGEDRHSVTIVATVAGRTVRIEELGTLVPRPFPDVDQIAVLVDPPDSAMEVTGVVEGGPAPAGGARLGRRDLALPLRFEADDPSLGVPAVEVRESAEGKPPVWIYRNPAAVGEDGKMPRSIEERLRALGYVQ